MRIIILALLLAVTTYKLAAQEQAVRQRLNSLVAVESLPEDILSSKTVVLVDVPYTGQNPQIRGDWQEIAEIAQMGFQKAGIDAVAYYHIDDILSGPEAYQAYLDALDDRNLSHAAIMSFNGIEYQLKLLKLTDRQFLISEGQQAYVTTGVELSRMMELLYRKAANSGLKRTNLLIIETPEHGEHVDIITAKRSEFYDLNFKGDDLAVPMFADTSQISEVMKSYPYKWGYVDGSKDDKSLRAAGYEYIVSYVKATTENARHILEYPVDDSETAFISEVIIEGKSKVVSQPTHAVVYKFYIRQLSNNNRYIGRRWDAGYTWQEGLSNYIANLRNELVRQ